MSTIWRKNGHPATCPILRNFGTLEMPNLAGNPFSCVNLKTKVNAGKTF